MIIFFNPWFFVIAQMFASIFLYKILKSIQILINNNITLLERICFALAPKEPLQLEDPQKHFCFLDPNLSN